MKKTRKLKKTENIGDTKNSKTQWKKILILIVLFCFCEVYLQSLEAVTNKEIQKIQSDISDCESDIDSLKMQKMEYVSFNHLAEVAQNNGYEYKNDYYGNLSKDEQDSTEPEQFLNDTEQTEITND